MNLNDFGANLITQLTRIADALESKQVAPTTANSAAAAEPESKPAAKKTTQAAAKKTTQPAAEKPAAEKPAAKRDFAEVKAILITVKDTIGKEAAQECYRTYEYTAMSKIQPEHYDAIFDDATKALEEFEAGGNDSGDDDL